MKRWPSILPILCGAVLLVSYLEFSGIHSGRTPLPVIMAICFISMGRWAMSVILREGGRGWVWYTLIVSTSILWVFPVWFGSWAVVKHLWSSSEANVLGIPGQGLVDFLESPIPWFLLMGLLVLYALVIVGFQLVKNRRI